MKNVMKIVFIDLFKKVTLRLYNTIVFLFICFVLIIFVFKALLKFFEIKMIYDLHTFWFRPSKKGHTKCD